MRTRILILGGGFAGMRALVRLHERLDDAVELTLVDRSAETLMTPLLVDAVFGSRGVDSLRFPFAEAARRRGRFVNASVTAVDVAERVVRTSEGDALLYDYLFLALGAHRALDSIPGLAEHAGLLWTAQTANALRARLDAFTGGPVVVFDAPSAFGTAQQRQPQLGSALENAATEAALRVDAWLRARSLRGASSVTRVTPNPVVAASAGPAGRAVLERELHTAEVHVRVDGRVSQLRPDGVQLADGEWLPSALTIALPPYEGPVPLRDTGIVDECGYVVVDPDTFLVPDHPEIACAGDACALQVPKLGHLAAIQADVAAASLAAQIDGQAQIAEYEPELMYLMAGGPERSQLIYSTVLYGGTDDYVYESPSIDFMRFTMNAWYATTHGELPPDLAKNATRRFLRGLERRV